MSDMDNLMALKAMLEGSAATKKETPEEREQRFLKEAVKFHLGEAEDVNGLGNYHPEEMVAFLESVPSMELARIMGGEWKEMNPMAFDALVYSVNKKLKKSATMIDWSN